MANSERAYAISSTVASKAVGRPQLMRAINEQSLVDHIRHGGAQSRTDLVCASGLSKSTVTLALSNLQAAGLIQPSGRRSGLSGPAATLYDVRPEAGFVLGLDVGREYLRGSLVDLAGAARSQGSRPAHGAGRRGRVVELSALADDLCGEAGISRDQITQTVIGSPGVYDPERLALTMARNLPGWEEPAVLTELFEAFGPETLVENDIDLAAVAEHAYGHGQGTDSFAFVSVGSGVGMGLVMKGQLHRGFHRAAGEIAFLPLGDELVSAQRLRPSQLRGHGRLESALSGAGVVRAARAAGIPKLSSAREVFAAAAAGDERAAEVVRAEGRLLSKALASIVTVVDPELIVLGGGIGRAPGFASLVEGSLRELVRFPPALKVSALGEGAIVDGAIAAGTERAWQHLFDR